MSEQAMIDTIAVQQRQAAALYFCLVYLGSGRGSRRDCP